MSGGSLSYGFRNIQQLSDEIRDKAETELEHKFALHLEEVAKAAKALEWYYSGDSGPETAYDLINIILNKEEE
jgi:hypothetical protein